MKEALLYTQTDKSTLQCQACNHFCLIKHNKTGLCRVRKNKSNVLQSLVYGLPAVINVDPIEKKPLFHFLPGTQTYSIGTNGCNLTCKNCQNHSLSQVSKIEKLSETQDYFTPEKIVDLALGDGCKSIAYTYNEPTIFFEYALDIMKLAQMNGLKNVWVSNGYMSDQVLNLILPYLDAINVDLKSLENNFYIDNCGAKINPILNNLKKIKQEQVHLEVTTLIVPTLSSDINMLGEIAQFIVKELDDDTPWHISRFTPEISWKLKNLSSTGDDLIYEAYELGKDAGLKYVYVGNVPGDQKENTYCPKCNELSIRRLGYHIERLDIHGRCAYCDKNLDIID